MTDEDERQLFEKLTQDIIKCRQSLIQQGEQFKKNKETPFMTPAEIINTINYVFYDIPQNHVDYILLRLFETSNSYQNVITSLPSPISSHSPSLTHSLSAVRLQ